MLGREIRENSPFRAVVATVVAICVLAAVTPASGHQAGARPRDGEYVGRFIGPGGNGSFIALRTASQQTGPTTFITGLQAINGAVPAVCVKNGRTRVAGSDGQIAIGFSSQHSGLRRRPRVALRDDGSFAFRLVHDADVFVEESYSLTVRGTFEQRTVSGRVQGASSSDFFGKCRANRTFTARLTKG